jgi:hypothetical protein
MAAPRCIVPGNLKSASAHLIASPIGGDAFGLAFLDILDSLLGVADALLDLAGNLF